MKKEEYLRDDAVQRFAKWFAMKLLDGTPIVMLRLRSGQRRVLGLPDTFARYDWPFTVRVAGETCRGRSFEDSARVLEAVRHGLRTAVQSRDDRETRSWCATAFKWGGVTQGNVKWANGLRGIAGHLSEVSVKLRNGHDNGVTTERFNSGLTKIYSLLLDDFIIYDSRVAAALAWFVQSWRTSQGLQARESGLLGFACMPPKEGPAASRRKQRRPLAGDFPMVHGNGARHALWNVRANWVLTQALHYAEAFLAGGGPRAEWCDVIVRHSQPLRAIEATLFMWGYDLPHAPPPDQLHGVQNLVLT